MFYSAYDRAAIKFRGVEADINFSLADYEDDLKQVGHPSLLKRERERERESQRLKERNGETCY